MHINVWCQNQFRMNFRYECMTVFFLCTSGEFDRESISAIGKYQGGNVFFHLFYYAFIL